VYRANSAPDEIIPGDLTSLSSGILDN